MRIGIGLGVGQGGIGGAGTPSVYETIIDTLLSGTSWTAPSSPASQDIVVECWSGAEGGVTNTRAGGGGSYSRLDAYTVAADASVSYAVGQGGAAESTDAATNTTWDTSQCVAVAPSGATGGAAGSCTGDQAYSGGDGGTGTGNQNPGASAGSTSSASTITPGEPEGGASQTLEAISGWGVGGASSAGSAENGVQGFLRVTYQGPADTDFPREVGYAEVRYGVVTVGDDIVIPSGDTGDVLLAVFRWDGNPVISMTGWTKVTEDTNGSTPTLSIFKRTATGSDPTAFTIDSTEIGGCAVVRLRDCDIDSIEAATAATGSDNAPDPPTNTPSGGSGNYRYYTICAWDATSRCTSYPSSYEGRRELAPSSVSDAGLALAFRDVAGASENPGVFAISRPAGRAWVAQTLSMSKP